MSFRTTSSTTAVGTAVDYVENVSPGSGALPPRAWYASSDAKSLSLNGRWRFQQLVFAQEFNFYTWQAAA
ncbi:hypothetical protein ACWD25_37035, partial [Streptomyces sp. NPDC002920]